MEVEELDVHEVCSREVLEVLLARNIALALLQAAMASVSRRATLPIFEARGISSTPTGVDHSFWTSEADRNACGL